MSNLKTLHQLQRLSNLKRPDGIKGNLGTQKQIGEHSGEIILADVAYEDPNKSGPLVATIVNAINDTVYVPGCGITLEARIRYGVSGMLADSGFFRWAHSLSIPLQGNWARLSARVTDGATGNTYDIGGFISNGTSSRKYSPLTIDAEQLVAAGNFVDVVIPDFCKAVSVMATNPVGPANIFTPAFTVLLRRYAAPFDFTIAHHSFPAGGALIEFPVGSASEVSLTSFDPQDILFKILFHIEL